MLRRRALEIVDNLAAELAQVHRLGRDRDGAAARARVVGQAADHLAHPRDASGDPLGGLVVSRIQIRTKQQSGEVATAASGL